MPHVLVRRTTKPPPVGTPYHPIFFLIIRVLLRMNACMPERFTARRNIVRFHRLDFARSLLYTQSLRARVSETLRAKQIARRASMAYCTMDIRPRAWTRSDWVHDLAARTERAEILSHGDAAAAAAAIEHDDKTRTSGRRPRTIVAVVIAVAGDAPAWPTDRVSAWARDTQAWGYAMLGPESIIVGCALDRRERAVHVGAVPIEDGRISWTARQRAYLAGAGESRGPTYGRLLTLYARDVGARYGLERPGRDQAAECAKQRGKALVAEVARVKDEARAATSGARTKAERAFWDGHAAGRTMILDGVDAAVAKDDTPDVVHGWWDNARARIEHPSDIWRLPHSTPEDAAADLERELRRWNHDGATKT